MVDRITPATTDDDREELARRFAVVDRWPVVCEPFAQWVLEDTPGELPPLERAGVQLVTDVAPYELMKLRLLNASHQALAYFGYLAGYRFIHEACGDPLFARFLLAYMDREATGTLEPVPGIDLAAYKRELITRFSNPHIRDTLARNATSTSDRIPKFLLPVLRQNLERGGPVELCAAVVASWARYAEGVDEQGHPIEVNDPLRDTLMAAAWAQHADPLAFVRNRDVFGDLVDDERFTEPYLAALDSLHTRGARATVQSLLG
jgi:mannitol 2-dehydrogenase